MRYFFEVRSVRLVDRNEITPEQAGTASPGSGGKYWLFELGASTPMPEPLVLKYRSPFRFSITGKADLVKVKGWDDMPQRYSYLYL